MAKLILQKGKLYKLDTLCEEEKADLEVDMRFSVLSLGTASVGIEAGSGIVISQQASEASDPPEN